MLREVQVGLALIDDGDQERQVFGRAAGVPGVALPAQAGDVAEAAAHLGVRVLEDVQGVGELVAGVPPGAVVPGFLVAAVFAVQQRELRGRGRGELAQPGVDEAGLAVAGQPGDADPGEARAAGGSGHCRSHRGRRRARSGWWGSKVPGGHWSGPNGSASGSSRRARTMSRPGAAWVTPTRTERQ